MGGYVTVQLPGTMMVSFLDPSSRRGQRQTHAAFNAKVAEQPGDFYAVPVQVCRGELRASRSRARCRFPPCHRSLAAREAAPRQGCRRVLREAPSLLRALLSPPQLPGSSPDPPALVRSSSCEPVEAEPPVPGSSPRTVPQPGGFFQPPALAPRAHGPVSRWLRFLWARFQGDNNSSTIGQIPIPL